MKHDVYIVTKRAEGWITRFSPKSSSTTYEFGWEL